MTLSAWCEDPIESNAMKWLCTKGPVGNTLWNNFIECQHIGIAEFLALFPSCNPSIEVLTECIRPLSPRYYSITSSPLIEPKTVRIALSLIRYNCGIHTGGVIQNTTPDQIIKRSGLCSTYLENILSPWLQHQSNDNYIKSPTNPVKIRFYVKPTSNFRLPSPVASPLMFIGPGTGIAPFVGFLDHIGESQKTQGSDVIKNEIMVFHGCRTENEILYAVKYTMRLCICTNEYYKYMYIAFKFYLERFYMLYMYIYRMKLILMCNLGPLHFLTSHCHVSRMIKCMSHTSKHIYVYT
jgi:sulfite reductase alpha subunit-like flavoprotein